MKKFGGFFRLDFQPFFRSFLLFLVLCVFFLLLLLLFFLVLITLFFLLIFLSRVFWPLLCLLGHIHFFPCHVARHLRIALLDLLGLGRQGLRLLRLLKFFILNASERLFLMLLVLVWLLGDDGLLAAVIL